MLTLQDVLTQILRKEQIKSSCVVCESAYSRNECIEEMTTGALLSFSAFFVEAYILDQQKERSEKATELLRKYCEECDYYRIVPRRYSEAGRRATEVGFLREDKIFFLREKLLFDATHLQWDSREWVLELLRHLYILAVELQNFIRMEKEIAHCPRSAGEAPAITCVKVDARGMRESMLVNRNNPTMTLGEFAEKLMAQQSKQAAQSATLPAMDSSDSIEMLRKRDEFRDDLHFMKGNTLGKG